MIYPFFKLNYCVFFAAFVFGGCSGASNARLNSDIDNKDEIDTYEELVQMAEDLEILPCICRISKHPQHLAIEPLRHLGKIVEFDNRQMITDVPFFYYLSSASEKNGIVIICGAWSVSNAAKDGMIWSHVSSPLLDLNTSEDANPRYLRVPKMPFCGDRCFFWTKYRGEQIGDFAYDRRCGGFRKHHTACLNFYRGNTFVQLYHTNVQELQTAGLPGQSLDKINFRHLALDALRDKDVTKDIDIKQIAYEIDQYLKTPPTDKLNETEKRKLKTLTVTLPPNTNIEVNKEYALDFSRRQTDGQAPAEIRLIVSRGDIKMLQEKTKEVKSIDDVSEPVIGGGQPLPPHVDGKYVVRFSKPGKQTVGVYHIDETGKCTAWGEISVNVE